MSCSKYREHIPAYLDGDLSGEDRDRLESHLEECSACSETAEEMRASLLVFRAVEHRDSCPSLSEIKIKRLSAIGRERASRRVSLRRLAAIVLIMAGLAGSGILTYNFYNGPETTPRNPANATSIRFQSENIGVHIGDNNFILHSGNRKDNDSIDLRL
jgi:predicted anti-sigma-YlaC factor YlaD